MLTININLETGLAKPSQAVVVKAGGVAPVRVVFSANPGAAPVIELALSPQQATPAVVAYLDAWAGQSQTVYTGTLNLNDSRLIELLDSKQAQTLDAEVAVTVAGSRRVFPNFPVTVQTPVITGPEASEGGPVWLNQALGDARYVNGESAVLKFLLEAPDGGVWELSITNEGQIERRKV